MKKILLICATFALLQAMESRFFIGGFVSGAANTTLIESHYDGGYWVANNSNSKFYDVTHTNKYDNTIFDLNYGGRLGYLIMTTKTEGIKLYGSFTTGKATFGRKGETSSLYFYQAGGGVDYNIFFTPDDSAWGFFAGIGYDYGFGKFFDDLLNRQNANITNHSFYTNIGFSKNFTKWLRFDIGVKIPVYYYNKESITQADPINGFTSPTYINGKFGRVTTKTIFKNDANVYLSMDLMF